MFIVLKGNVVHDKVGMILSALKSPLACMFLLPLISSRTHHVPFFVAQVPSFLFSLCFYFLLFFYSYFTYPADRVLQVRRSDQAVCFFVCTYEAMGVFFVSVSVCTYICV
jgi:hypothetical protein